MKDTQYEFYQTSKPLTDDDTRYTYQSSLTFLTEAEAAEAGKKDETMFKQAKQECLNKSLFAIQQYLKETHAYPDIELTIPVWSMKAKSFDYADMDEAQGKAIAGLKSYSGSGLNDENKKMFQDAISIWEKGLQEYNPEDKKARINPKNVGGLYANLAIAHNWLMNDQEALKYVDLLSKSRGSSWAEMIGDMVNSGIKGREQNAKRNNNTLAIDKTKSPHYVSPDFLIKGHSHRISAIQKNNFLNKKLPDERRYFEYQENGLLSKTYTESYNAGTKSWEKRRDVHTIKYDNDRSIMYTYDEKSPTIPLMIRKFKNGKLVYQKSRINLNDSTVVKFYYNASGQLERYVSNPHLATPTSEVRYQYANGQMTRKEVFTNKSDQLKPSLREEYSWNGNKLDKTSRFLMGDTGKYPDKPLEIQYHYDTRGYLTGLDYVGHETQTFTVDEAGNILEINSRADDGGSKSPTNIWEPGTGNAFLYTTEVNDFTGPEKFPALY
jgi:YD repeat-containing protein